MTTYEKLLTKAENLGIRVKEINFGTDKECGFYEDNKALVNRNINEKQKHTVLAEEMGHHFKTTGDITDQSKVENRKQEKLARRWAYEETVGIIKIIEAHNKGIRNKHDLAEYLDLTEQCIEEAIKYYREKYGLFFEIDNYIVQFEPTLGIYKKF